MMTVMTIMALIASAIVIEYLRSLVVGIQDQMDHLWWDSRTRWIGRAHFMDQMNFFL